MSNKQSIIEQLNKSRSKQTVKLTRVNGDIVATWQVKKRKDNDLSEMSLYEIEGGHYLVLHQNKRHPDPEKVLSRVGGIVVYQVGENTFHTVLQGIMYYRTERLEDNYVNSYSFIVGWCNSNGVKIHLLLDKQ